MAARSTGLRGPDAPPRGSIFSGSDAISPKCSLAPSLPILICSSVVVRSRRSAATTPSLFLQWGQGIKFYCGAICVRVFILAGILCKKAMNER